jgi:hypothetical protein
VAADRAHGPELALEWCDSTKEDEAVAGWATLGGRVAIKDDAELDIAELKQLLQRVQTTIHDQPDRVRYVMNAFVISVGSYVRELTEFAVAVAKKIGRVSVDMGNTACKVPDAAEYIDKVRKRGTLGKKRKTVKC